MRSLLNAVAAAVGSLAIGAVPLAWAEPGVPSAADLDDRPAIVMRTAHAPRAPHLPAISAASTANDLSYHGGVGGIGVETAPKVYLVLWGSQWTNNDPSGEAALLQSFYSNVGGSAWNNSVTQYCQGVQSGTVVCPAGAQVAGNPSSLLAGFWADKASPAPSRPRQSQLAAEAVKAAQHFGNTSASSNASVQYVIATATHNNSRGFGTQYCAYHSSTSSSLGNVAYTNLPYVTDAGASCGANFNGLGPKAGITIVGGHEWIRSERSRSRVWGPGPSSCGRSSG